VLETENHLMFSTISHVRNVLVAGLAVALLTACGSVWVDLEETPSTPHSTDPSAQPPAEVLNAFQTTLALLQSAYPDSAPTSDAGWQTDDITPPGLVGSGGYRFTIEGWQIDITYPIVAPEAMIYNIRAEHTTSDLHWEATIDAQGQIIDSSTPLQALAWPGRVIGDAQSGALLFEISGEVGIVVLTNHDPMIMDRLQTLREDSGPQGFVHLWGTLDCSDSGEAQCTLEVTRIRSGTEITEPEPIGPWEGVLHARTGPPSSGGDDWFALLGDWPIQYGVWARDESLRAELEGFQDTNQVIRIWGEMTVGVPDWNGTQIIVSDFEIVE
jgi:hypothetical protein